MDLPLVRGRSAPGPEATAGTRHSASPSRWEASGRTGSEKNISKYFKKYFKQVLPRPLAGGHRETVQLRRSRSLDTSGRGAGGHGIYRSC